MDIMRDGIMLHEVERQPFVKPGDMTKEQKQGEAQKYFDELYTRSLAALEFSKISFSKSQGKINGYMRNAAFLAH